MSGLFDVPLLDEEPLTSYLARLARANSAPNLRSFCKYFRLDGRGIYRGDDDAILSLANLVGRPFEELRSSAVAVDENHYAIIADSCFPTRLLRRSKLRFCPHCIIADDHDERLMPGARRHARLHWMFPQIRTCPVHSTLIVETDDPRLKSLQYDLISQLEVIDDQIPELLAASTHRSGSAFETFVHQRLLGTRSHGDFLDRLPLAVAITACELFGTAEAFGRDAMATDLSEEDLVGARESAYRSFSKGHAGFSALIDRIRSPDQSIKAGGLALYGKLYSALSTGYREPEYDVLREHLRGHTMSVVPIINGAAFFGEVTDSHWTTVTSIVKETKCSHQTILRLLVKLGHLDAGQQSNPVRYIKVAAANDVIERLTDLITLEEVATILGLTRARALHLARDGLFKPALSDAHVQDQGYCLLDRYSRSDTVQLRERLLGLAKPSPLKGWVPIHVVVHRAGLRYVDILNLVSEGRLQNFGSSDESAGLSGLRFDLEEVEKAAEQPTDAMMGRVEICSKLLLTAEAFAFLVRTGHLRAKQKQLRSARVPVWVMSRADFDDFNSQYVTYALLSNETGIGARGLGRRRSERGVPLAFPQESVKQFIIERKYLKVLFEGDS
jgi:hypothetical protein